MFRIKKQIEPKTLSIAEAAPLLKKSEKYLANNWPEICKASGIKVYREVGKRGRGRGVALDRRDVERAETMYPVLA